MPLVVPVAKGLSLSDRLGLPKVLRKLLLSVRALGMVLYLSLPLLSNGLLRSDLMGAGLLGTLKMLGSMRRPEANVVLRIGGAPVSDGDEPLNGSIRL